ncbi:MAG: hypothetical protein ACOC71_02675 [Hyphomicrobiales bacterium]
MQRAERPWRGEGVEGRHDQDLSGAAGIIRKKPSNRNAEAAWRPCPAGPARSAFLNHMLRKFEPSKAGADHE